MKKILFLLIVAMTLFSCRTTSSVIKVSHNLKAQPTISLHMPQGDGFNGGGVAYNTKNKTYYAAFAGNAYFPMQAFEEGGRPIGKDLKIKVDMRGLWYNPKTQNLEANGFGEDPIVKYIWEDGIPTQTEPIIEDIEKPDAQTIATYDYDSDEILMFNEGQIHRFSHKNGESLGTYILKSMPKNHKVNENVMAYTGFKDGEIALLDYEAKKVYLFQKNTGEFKGTIQLPSDARTEENFNFAIANNIIWLFNTDKRTWMGYKIK